LIGDSVTSWPLQLAKNNEEINPEKCLHPNYKSFYPRNRKAWRAWLEKNHAKSPGIWLVYFKKKSNKPTVTYAESVEEALCFGWIDSTMRPLDEERFIQRFTPRKPKSVWSALNKTRIEKMINEGLMTAAGLEKIEIAKENGSWTSIDHVEKLEVPADLQKALNKNKTALKNFSKLANFAKKQILYRINSAKRPETRKERIEKIMELLKKTKGKA
jgi:uncharacterized protein YdeI (YjbR/CyaY-like superfamily)